LLAWHISGFPIDGLDRFDLLGRINAVNLEHVFGEIQTDRGNLHVDDNHPTTLQRRGAGAVHHITNRLVHRKTHDCTDRDGNDLLDHLVGARDQRPWDFEAECLAVVNAFGNSGKTRGQGSPF
jgi:hypothetical protein